MVQEARKTKGKRRSAAQAVLRRAAASPGGFLRAKDLRGVSPTAASKALARLAETGVLTRVSKGLYYVPRETILGTSRPSELEALLLRTEEHARPTGETAANLLGLTTQVPARPQVAVYAAAKPKHSDAARVSLRKSARPNPLDRRDAALLEFLRDRGRTSDLPPQQMVERLRDLLASGHDTKSLSRLKALTAAAGDEPPRVRAILGALLAWLNAPADDLSQKLRESLNPLSRFDFGAFRVLPNAKEWQAK